MKVKILKKFCVDGKLYQCWQRDTSNQFILDEHMQRIPMYADIKGEALKAAKKINAVEKA